MKRTGARRSGEYKEITWDEAIAELTGQLGHLAAARTRNRWRSSPGLIAAVARRSPRSS